jgi:hypothetical protein
MFKMFIFLQFISAYEKGIFGQYAFLTIDFAQQLDQ